MITFLLGFGAGVLATALWAAMASAGKQPEPPSAPYKIEVERDTPEDYRRQWVIMRAAIDALGTQREA